MDKFFKTDEPIDEHEEHPKYFKVEKNPKDLRNKIVYLFTDYYYIAESMVEIIKLLSKQQLKEVITFKYKSNPKNKLIKIFNFEEGRDIKISLLKNIFPKNEKLKKNSPGDLIQIMENFLCRYLYNKELEFFQINQPISYENNLTLYYNYIIYLFYEIVIEVDEMQNQIYYKTSKFLKYFNLRQFHDILFDKFLDEKLQFNEIFNQLLQFLLFALSSKSNKNIYIDNDSLHFKKLEKFLTPHKANQLVKKFNNKFASINTEIKEGKIIFSENKKLLFEFILEDYSEKILNYKIGMDIFCYNISFEKFQITNFFLETDLNYLKYLIRKILSSNLFKSIFDKFSNVSTVADFYFKYPSNIGDYIDRIIFLPFKVSEIGRYAITDRLLLSVLVSGYPQKEIIDINEFRIYRIIELSLRSIVLSDHEPSHFIKAVYSILTGGIISRFTQKDNADIDSGSLLEEILFTWSSNKNKPLDLSQFNLDENIKYNNTDLLEKKIDLITALTLLNPKIYSQDLNYFRKSLFEVTKEDLKTFSVFSDNLDLVYKEYLQSVITDEIINNSVESDIYINAAMESGNSSYIDYIITNHNSS